jgi:Zn-dependent protease with chaperone function
MNFFEHQEQARRKTGQLIFYFLLALLGIIGATYTLVIGVLFLMGELEGESFFRPRIFAATLGGTCLVVFIASAFKSLQLSSGGSAVARELGGREIDTNTNDFHERRLLNVVEEMAIASGVPVPAVYVMDRESSINAFAAGRTTSDAVIGVTRGCMTLLNREELQGVIAHEFSHILNGDMRLNIRLMGMLFGILFLALMGEILMRSTFYSSGSSRRGGGNIGLVLLVAGLGLMLIGFVGSFFARLIKASISRQREFLADASAVQFTRNPNGLAGALAKIGGLSEGSSVTHPMAKDASHLFFSNAISSELLATHPPLPERIKRLLPQWDGGYDKVDFPALNKSEHSGKPEAVSAFSGAANSATQLSEAEAIESFKSLHPEQIALGNAVHAAIPERWHDFCRNPSGSQTLVFSLLVAQNQTTRENQLNLLRKVFDNDSVRIISELASEVSQIHSTLKLGLIDLAIPSLRRLSSGEYDRFRKLTHELIASDQQVDLFEFALLQVITRHLDTSFGRRRLPRIKFNSLRRLTDDAGVLLSTLADLGHPDNPDQSLNAFQSAVTELKTSTGLTIPHKSGNDCGLDAIKAALIQFEQSSPTVKRQLIEACTRSVLMDGVISSRESELIRAIADAIGCPIPPFVRTAPLV